MAVLIPMSRPLRGASVPAGFPTKKISQPKISFREPRCRRAENGSVSDAKSAKRKANKSYNEAKDSRSARKKVSEQEDKIAHDKKDLEKKQQRLEDLVAMRVALYAQLPTDSIPQVQQ